MSPNPGDSLGVLTPSPFCDAPCDRRASVNCGHNIKEMLVRVCILVLAPVLANVVDCLAGRERLQNARPERGDYQSRAIYASAVDEVVCHGEIDPVDSVGRAIEDARDKTRNVVSDPAPLHVIASWRSAGL